MSDFSFSVEGHNGQAQPLLAQAHDYYRSAAEQGRRDEESRSINILPEIFLQMILRYETCQRCGGDMDRVFIWNAQRLCRKCFGDGQDSWKIISADSRGADKLLANAAEQKTFFGSSISRLLRFLGLGKAPSREPLFAWNRIQEPARKRVSKDANDKHQMPRSEGLMNRKKKKLKKKC
jgi:hypothetical protein